MTRVTLTQFTNGTIADASAVDTELAKLATAVNGNIDTTNITAGSLDNTIFSAAYDPVARGKDTVSNFVLSGLTMATSASLSTTIIGGVYYVSGKKVTIANTPITVVASKDTYIDLKDDGTAVQVAVANGATSGMTLTTNADGTSAIRIGVLISSGSAITTVSQIGLDALGNYMLNRSPVTPPVIPYTNPGSAGGSFYYRNFAGIKEFWGATNNITATGTGIVSSATKDITLPVGFFNVINTPLLSTGIASGSQFILPTNIAMSTTTLQVQVIQFNGTNGTAAVCVYLRGF